MLSKLRGLDPTDPVSVAQAKAAIHGPESEPFAKMIGVTRTELGKPVAALEKTIDNMGTTPDEAAAALAGFNNMLNDDASLSKAFNKSTFPGQLLRGVALGFAGVSMAPISSSMPTRPIRRTISRCW